MAVALEERCSQEVINCDETIKLLKEENESLEATKAHLSEDAKLLPAAREEVASLKREKEGLELTVAKLWKEVDDVGAAKDMAVQRRAKAEEILNCLHEELEAEHKLVASLRDRLKEAEV
jgi:chromosome segregation ATPase